MTNHEELLEAQQETNRLLESIDWLGWLLLAGVGTLIGMKFVDAGFS